MFPRCKGHTVAAYVIGICWAAGCQASAAVPLVDQTAVEGLAANIPISAMQDMMEGHAFTAAFSTSFVMILATEMGDKTFFIAAIMAMKQSRSQVLIGALSALFIMTVLSAALGKAFPMVIDKRHTSKAAALLFAYFGVQLLWEYWKHRGDEEGESEELHEVEESLQADPLVGDDKIHRSPTPVTGKSERREPSGPKFSWIPPTLLRSFTLTFLAEWGDRSQIATIALAAAKDVFGVTIGAILGHTICTSIAVLGGRMLAARISEKIVNLIGGVLFLLFAVFTFTGHLD